ncbi:alpha/beta fold hydrolase [Amycolatopsis sp. 195334CR]|uniref:alpha/beta fold hydrolase n=1 Tax=Amycolatopsis sp. 195334CR TaxID=2814588 RepID=UPI001A8ECAA9|nr:alpha/beta hydrolase [Amycolatopsis sp. 195334CR]MBN6033397.1 alpha/beta hydrolase [Amycolatopsis sp. 195334CR]
MGLDTAEWGEGRPVLFFSGAAMGCGFGFGTDLVASRGIRLISVERPWPGAPDRTLDTWVEDVRALGLPSCPIVAFSQGAPFGLACAAAGLCTSLVVVSGQDELRSFGDALDPDVARLIRAVDADPAGFEASFAATADAATMWELIAGMSSPVDLAVYTEPAFARAYRSALADGFRRGGAGYARDLVLALRPWPFAVEDIRVPVTLFYGAHDTSPVHSPDLGESLARRIPGATRHLVPDGGGSILWTHTPQILDAVIERG